MPGGIPIPPFPTPKLPIWVGLPPIGRLYLAFVFEEHLKKKVSIQALFSKTYIETVIN